jgi:hypothetical protein
MRGRLMMPRRSPTMGSRWTPLRLSGLDTFVEADPQWVTVVDGKAAAIADQTGKTSYAQATAGSRPGYVLDEATGQYALAMTAGSSIMSRAVAATTALEYTAALVVRSATPTVAAQVFTLNGTTGGWAQRTWSGSRMVGHNGIDGMIDGAMSMDAEVWVSVRTGGITRLYVNGEEKTLTSNNMSMLAVNAESRLGQFEGRLFSHVVYGRALSGEERKQLVSYLGAKYKVAVV